MVEHSRGPQISAILHTAAMNFVTSDYYLVTRTIIDLISFFHLILDRITLKIYSHSKQ